jgi:hypothetical protein
VRVFSLFRRPSEVDTAREATPGTTPDTPVVEAAPAALIERRGAPRRGLPLGPSLWAEFMLMGRPRSFQLEDVSMGGIGMRGPVDQARGIYVSMTLSPVQLQLGGRVLVANVQVRSCRSFRSFLLGEQVHIGCCFTGLDAQAEAQLLQLIAQLADARRGR